MVSGSPGSGTSLRLEIAKQPTDTTCGPTCLHAVYRFFADPIELDQVIAEVPMVPTGGTLAVLLAVHALRRGYSTILHTYHLQVFDPTWFQSTKVDLCAKLREQLEHKSSDPHLVFVTQAYLEYLALGGEIRYEDLSSALLRRYLKKDLPILTGLSSTYLYRSIREYGELDLEDDVRGTPQGHFAVLCGYEPQKRSVLVADPYHGNPLGCGPYYAEPMDRVLGAILLGALTFDANFLVIEPPRPAARGVKSSLARESRTRP